MTRQWRWLQECRPRLTRALARLVPLPVAVGPERVLINVLCVLVGAAALIPPSAPSSLWPRSVTLGWAVIMLVGGTATLVGYWRNLARGSVPWATSLERVGFLALFIAATAYGYRLIDVFGWRGVPVGLAFLAIGAAKGLRLLMSTATRDQVLGASRECLDDGAQS